MYRKQYVQWQVFFYTIALLKKSKHHFSLSEWLRVFFGNLFTGK